MLLVCITVSWKVECGLWKKGQQYYQDTQRYCTTQMQVIMSARLPPCVNLFAASYEHVHHPVQTCSLPHAIAFAAFFAASCNHIRPPLRMILQSEEHTVFVKTLARGMHLHEPANVFARGE